MSYGTFGTPRGIRIPVASVKGRCPRPLDDGGKGDWDEIKIQKPMNVVKRFHENG
jgi:hypothetical protein